MIEERKIDEVAADIVATFQRRAKVAMATLDVSLVERAEQAGWTRQSFYQALNGKNPTIKTIVKVSRTIHPSVYLPAFLMGNGTVDDMVRHLRRCEDQRKEMIDGFKRNV